MIQNLYQDNINLHRQLTRQSQVIEEAEKYQKEMNIFLDAEKQLQKEERDKDEEIEL